MDEPRTPREAKQEFLNDLFARGSSVVITAGMTVNDVMAENRKVLKETAEKHGLIIPPRI